MKIGMSTSCLYPVLTEVSLEKLGKAGIKNTEIFFNALCELKPTFVKELKRIARSYDMNVLSIHPTFSLAESFIFFSNYERRYTEGLDTYKRYAEIVCELGGKYIVMHGGKPNNAINNDEYFERFGNLSAVLKGMGATLLQENVVNFRAGDLDTLKRMSDYLGENAAFCLDVKQSLRGGYSPFDALKVLGDKVKHLHISDNLMPREDCLLPLEGNFDFAAFFKMAEDTGFSGAAVIEVYSNCFDSEDKLFSSYKSFAEKFS